MKIKIRLKSKNPFIFYGFDRRKSSYHLLPVFIESSKKPVLSTVSLFLLVSSHIAAKVGFVEWGTVLAPRYQKLLLF